MKNDLGINKIVQECEGKRVELSQHVIGPNVHDFMEMVVNFMLATGWNLDTIKSGLESAVEGIENRIPKIEEVLNDNDD